MKEKAMAFYKKYFTTELWIVVAASICFILFRVLIKPDLWDKFIRQAFFTKNAYSFQHFHYIRLILAHSIGIVFFFLVPFLFSLFVIKPKSEGFPHLRFKYHKTGLRLTLIMITIMIISVVIGLLVFPELSTYYPVSTFSTSTVGRFLLYEAVYFLFIVSWEYFSHSFLLFPFEKKMGNFAILIGLMPFIISHMGKPLTEQLGSVVAGIALVLLAKETRTFWYGAILHALIAITMDTSSVIFKLITKG